MSNKELLDSLGWDWIGMGYRPNGDGYGRFKHRTTRQTTRIGAGEANWNRDTELYKEACYRAMVKRING